MPTFPIITNPKYGIDTTKPIQAADYGVVPDSTSNATSNATALQYIFDSIATSSGYTGHTVVLPTGTTYVSSPILMHHPNTRLTGAGQYASTLSSYGYQ